jgi:hypothetical protein
MRTGRALAFVLLSLAAAACGRREAPAGGGSRTGAGPVVIGGLSLFYLFYWSSYPPRDLGPMVAARRWKTRIAGQETEAAETETFMGLKQQVLVTWLERPGGAGRFMMYTKNVPRETFNRILATMSF